MSSVCSGGEEGNQGGEDNECEHARRVRHVVDIIPYAPRSGQRVWAALLIVLWPGSPVLRLVTRMASNLAGGKWHSGQAVQQKVAPLLQDIDN